MRCIDAGSVEGAGDAHNSILSAQTVSSLAHDCQIPHDTHRGQCVAIVLLQPEKSDSNMGNWNPAVVWSLHSRLAASKRIYLDFNGHTTVGTSWNNWAQANGQPIVTPPCDGVSSGLRWAVHVSTSCKAVVVAWL